jgi:hypothetical protein
LLLSVIYNYIFSIKHSKKKEKKKRRRNLSVIWICSCKKKEEKRSNYRKLLPIYKIFNVKEHGFNNKNQIFAAAAAAAAATVSVPVWVCA